MKKNNKNLAIRDEISAMTVICNIQSMQNFVHGKAFDYSAFNSNTLDELHNLQDAMILEYNAALKVYNRPS